MRDVSGDGRPLTQIDFMHDQALNSIWSVAAQTFKSFQMRTKAFFWILEKLILDGHARLHKGGSLDEVPQTNQLADLRNAWPANRCDADKVVFVPGSADIGTGAGMDLWFFMEACPSGIAWRQPNGTYRAGE